MSKYWEIFKVSWEQNLVYRFNFVLWRIRNTVQLLLVYFIWWTVFQSQKSIFGYTNSVLITYILIAALIRAIVLSTRVPDMMNQINDGSIVNFLIKPLGFIRYYLARDIADKLFNILFYIVEVFLLVLILKPDVIIQRNIFVLAPFFLAITGGLVIYFCINFIISLTSFWVENSWGPFFLMAIFLEGFGGSLFPLDILPKSIYYFLMLTPFPYLIYFPSKLYLGNFNIAEMLYGFGIMFIWVVLLIVLMRYVLRLGFRHYSSVGN